jgi:hypothetical protein
VGARLPDRDPARLRHIPQAEQLEATLAVVRRFLESS